MNLGRLTFIVLLLLAGMQSTMVSAQVSAQILIPYEVLADNDELSEDLPSFEHLALSQGFSSDLALQAAAGGTGESWKVLSSAPKPNPIRAPPLLA